jgi:histidinol-phosphate aminotransferase
MKSIEEYYVPWVKGTPMYISSHIELAWQKPELHRMMSNENPNPPSAKVLEAIDKYSRMAHRYPDQGLVVRSKIAEINGLEGPQNVLIGNGSSEVFDNIFRCFLEPGDEVIQHTPCFGIYKLRCNILGGKLVSVPMVYKDKQLRYDADGILAAVTEKTKIIVVANPNNPTGNFMDASDFVRIAETGIPFIVDEAYIEYAGLGMSQVHLTENLQERPDHAHALEGLRAGGDAIWVCAGRCAGDRADLRCALAVECGHDPDVGCAGGAGRYGRAAGAGGVQQPGSEVHRGSAV